MNTLPRLIRGLAVRVFTFIAFPLLTAFSCSIPASQLDINKTIPPKEVAKLLLQSGLTCTSCSETDNYQKYSIQYKSKTLYVQINSSKQSKKYFLLVSGDSTSARPLIEEFAQSLRTIFDDDGVTATIKSSVLFSNVTGSGLYWGGVQQASLSITLPHNDALLPSDFDKSENRAVANKIKTITREVAQSMSLTDIGPYNFILGAENYWVSETVDGPFRYSRTVRLVGFDGVHAITLNFYGADRSLIKEWLKRFNKKIKEEVPNITFPEILYPNGEFVDAESG